MPASNTAAMAAMTRRCICDRLNSSSGWGVVAGCLTAGIAFRDCARDLTDQADCDPEQSYVVRLNCSVIREGDSDAAGFSILSSIRVTNAVYLRVLICRPSG